MNFIANNLSAVTFGFAIGAALPGLIFGIIGLSVSKPKAKVILGIFGIIFSISGLVYAASNSGWLALIVIIPLLINISVLTKKEKPLRQTPKEIKSDTIKYEKPGPCQPSSFVIVFLNWDGEILQRKKYEFCETPTYDGPTPIKPSDQFADYTFSGHWDEEVLPATCDKAYKADFKALRKTCNVTFLDEEKRVVEVKTINCGEKALSNKIVKRFYKNGDTYSFKGFDKNSIVFEDTTLTPTYHIRSRKTKIWITIGAIAATLTMVVLFFLDGVINEENFFVNWAAGIDFENTLINAAFVVFFVILSLIIKGKKNKVIVSGIGILLGIIGIVFCLIYPDQLPALVVIPTIINIVIFVRAKTIDKTAIPKELGKDFQEEKKKT